MLPSDFLHDQISLYHVQIAAVALIDRHNYNVLARQIDDAVAFGVAIFDRIAKRNDLMDPRALVAMSIEEADLLLSLYDRWVAETKPLLRVLDSSERHGVHIEQSEKLRERFRVTSLMDFDRERLMEQAKAAVRGEYKPLREAADEFRRLRYGSST